MDRSFPEMDGKDAIKIIRSDTEIKEIPMVALTAHAILSEREAILASGSNCMVNKPIDEDFLFETLATLMRQVTQ